MGAAAAEVGSSRGNRSGFIISRAAAAAQHTQPNFVGPRTSSRSGTQLEETKGGKGGGKSAASARRQNEPWPWNNESWQRNGDDSCDYGWCSPSFGRQKYPQIVLLRSVAISAQYRSATISVARSSLVGVVAMPSLVGVVYPPPSRLWVHCRHCGIRITREEIDTPAPSHERFCFWTRWAQLAAEVIEAARPAAMKAGVKRSTSISIEEGPSE